MKELNVPDLAAIKPPAKYVPYYTPDYARDARAILDTLFERKATVRVEARRYSPVTLKIQYYNGVKYLIDHLDPTGVYKTRAAQTKCSAYKTHIEFNMRPEHSELSEAVAIIPWKEKLTHFLENAETNDKLIIENILLTDAELDWINIQVSSCVKSDGETPLFFGQVSKDKIFLIKDTL